MSNQTSVLRNCFRQEASVAVELPQHALEWEGLNTDLGKAVAETYLKVMSNC